MLIETRRIQVMQEITVKNFIEAEVRPIHTDRLSHFRTEHEFLHYGEIFSPEQFTAYHQWAEKHRVPLVILGAGSNILFQRRRIRSLVLKNNLPKALIEIDNHTLQVSSSVMIAQMLKWCQDRKLDSCYYLASVPATIGGAIAMNAGRGRTHNQSIFDFVKSVTFMRDGEICTWDRNDISVAYRETPFTGKKTSLILHVILTFPPANTDANLRRERIQWSKEHQDHSDPNCGSVFKQSDSRLMRKMRGFRLFSASYSSKTQNWMLNHGNRSRPLVWLVRITKTLHFLIRKKAVMEIIEIN